jgi:hypothetical protein
MQHAVALSGEEDDPMTAISSPDDVDIVPGHATTAEPVKLALTYTWSGIKSLFHLLRPSTIRHGYQQFRQMTVKEMLRSFFSLILTVLRLLMIIFIYTIRYVATSKTFFNACICCHMHLDIHTYKHACAHMYIYSVCMLFSL